MKTTYRGVIRIGRKSFERNTVEGQTGVHVQDRGGGGGVGSDWAGNRSAEHSLANVELE
jgi:hypothetical protein